MTGPCEWDLSYAECSNTDALDSLSETDRDNIEAMAVQYLWNWTGRRFGLCSTSIRPCRSDCVEYSTFWGLGFRPDTRQRLVIGPSFDRSSVAYWADFDCVCGGGCRCTDASRTMRLPGPVHSVTSVVIDGETVDPGAYRVDNSVLLVRTDEGRWPRCQDLSAPPTARDTFEVTYTVGEDVPPGGKVAAGLLAAELARAMCNDKGCQLPQRIQSITRQGVTMAVLDTFEDIKEGRTGIWLIDSWVASVTAPTVSSGVFSVDIPRPRNRRQTWPSRP